VMRDPDGAAARAPQPGLGQVHQLVDDARSLGATIRFTVRGKIVQLPDDVDLVAYRTLQEALTNARRHAAGAEIEASLDYAPKTVHITVRDHGPGVIAGTDSGGFGLIGMRERVEAVGGSVTFGDHADGGFEVVAELPTRAAAP
jgi:signal transduction histidine kinase